MSPFTTELPVQELPNTQEKTKHNYQHDSSQEKKAEYEQLPKHFWKKFIGFFVKLSLIFIVSI